MRTKKVAIYARVNHLGFDHGLQYQIETCRKAIEQAGGKQRGIYLDVASGNDSNRPGFRQIMKDARCGNFKMIAVTYLDRLARDVFQGVKSLKTLKKLRVEIMPPA